jgi:predicted nucleic acid-binding Zn ribbon protein
VSVEGDHRHCKVCGRTCDVDSETCSRACAERRAQQLQSRRNYTYLLYASIAILFVVLVSRLV